MAEHTSESPIPHIDERAVDGDGQADGQSVDVLTRGLVSSLHHKVASDLTEHAQRHLLNVGLLLHTALRALDRHEQHERVTGALDELHIALNAVRTATLDLIDGSDLLS